MDTGGGTITAVETTTADMEARRSASKMIAIKLCIINMPQASAANTSPPSPASYLSTCRDIIRRA